MTTRFCLWCASEYTPKRNVDKKRRHLYCSDKCRSKAWTKTRSEKRRQSKRNAAKG